MIVLLIVMIFLFLFFEERVEIGLRAYVDEIYVKHPDKDPFVTCLITHVFPFWTGFITFIALLASMQQTKNLANLGDVVMLAALCGTTIFMGYVTKCYDDIANKWEKRVNAQQS